MVWQRAFPWCHAHCRYLRWWGRWIDWRSPRWLLSIDCTCLACIYARHIMSIQRLVIFVLAYNNAVLRRTSRRSNSLWFGTYPHSNKRPLWKFCLHSPTEIAPESYDLCAMVVLSITCNWSGSRPTRRLQSCKKKPRVARRVCVYRCITTSPLIMFTRRVV